MIMKQETEEQMKAAADACKKAYEAGKKRGWKWWQAALAAVLAGALAWCLTGCGTGGEITWSHPDFGTVTVTGNRPVIIQKGK